MAQGVGGPKGRHESASRVRATQTKNLSDRKTLQADQVEKCAYKILRLRSGPPTSPLIMPTPESRGEQLWKGSLRHYPASQEKGEKKLHSREKTRLIGSRTLLHEQVSEIPKAAPTALEDSTHVVATDPHLAPASEIDEGEAAGPASTPHYLLRQSFRQIQEGLRDVLTDSEEHQEIKEKLEQIALCITELDRGIQVPLKNLLILKDVEVFLDASFTDKYDDLKGYFRNCYKEISHVVKNAIDSEYTLGVSITSVADLDTQVILMQAFNGDIGKDLVLGSLKASPNGMRYSIEEGLGASFGMGVEFDISLENKEALYTLELNSYSTATDSLKELSLVQGWRSKKASDHNPIESPLSLLNRLHDRVSICLPSINNKEQLAECSPGKVVYKIPLLIFAASDRTASTKLITVINHFRGMQIFVARTV